MTQLAIDHFSNVDSSHQNLLFSVCCGCVVGMSPIFNAKKNVSKIHELKLKIFKLTVDPVANCVLPSMKTSRAHDMHRAMVADYPNRR